MGRDATPLLVIINPTSGGGAGVHMPAEAGRALGDRGVAHEVRITERAGHAVELAREAVLRHVSAVVAVGGDGTVHEVVNGVLQARQRDPASPTAVGLVPVGTGNDFVKVVAGATPRARAWDTVAHGSVRWLDAGIARWNGASEYFINAAGTGIDVEVVRQMGPHRGTRGGLAYILALLRSLRRYRPLPVRLAADGQHYEHSIMTVAVANGRCIGGTFHICPQALPDDGLFDVCAVESLSLARSLVTAACIMRGKHGQLAAVHNLRARRVDLEVPAGTPLFFQLDGELREPAGVRRITFEILAEALPVLHQPAGPAAART
jgi:YegS/Rv2252/BmrU family lipid kinase